MLQYLTNSITEYVSKNYVYYYICKEFNCIENFKIQYLIKINCIKILQNLRIRVH